MLLLAILIPSIVFGGEPRRLTNDGSLKLTPVYGQRGESILYSTHDEPNRVTLMRLTLSTGLSERVDSSLSAHQLDPDITSDGRFLCFVLTYTSPQSILVMRDLKEGTEARYIPVEARGTVRSPRISPDQKFVVFTLSDPGGQQIARVDINGENLKRLTSTVGTNAWPSLSPDGKMIAFGSSREGSFQIYVMNVDGNDVRQLTNQDLRCMRPVWSPDGHRIAFVSVRESNLDICVMNRDGSNVRTVTTNLERDDFPAWHPDSHHLVVVSEYDGDSDLYEIDVDE